MLGIAGEGPDGNNGRRTYNVTFQMPDPEAEARQRQEAEAKRPYKILGPTTETQKTLVSLMN